jgi:nitrogen regulatory protein PII 1
MVLIKSYVRREKADEVVSRLLDAGYASVTRVDVYGRGKQRGIKHGDIVYDELPKELLITVVPETEKDFVIQAVLGSARTGKGNFGDGKIFVEPVAECYTISTGKPAL